MVSAQHSSNSREKPAPAADEATPEWYAQASDQISVEQPSDEAVTCSTRVSAFVV